MRLLLLTQFLFAVAVSFGQTGNLGIGFDASLNKSWNKKKCCEPGPEPSRLQVVPLSGFSAGMVANYQLTEHVLLRGHATFVENRSSWKLQDPPYQYTWKETDGWIAVPLNCNYVINPKARRKLYVGTGLSIRGLVAARQEYEATSSSDPLVYVSSAVLEVRRKLGYVVSFQSGVILPSSLQWRYFLEICYTRSLSNQVRDHAAGLDYDSYDFDHRLSSFAIALGYFFVRRD